MQQQHKLYQNYNLFVTFHVILSEARDPYLKTVNIKVADQAGSYS